MKGQIDFDRFAHDYREGVNDRQLVSRYGITSQEMIAVVKKLISEGKITRQDYFNRKKKIEEYEARQERDFLKSLYQCPVCGHIHPVPFRECPACETDISNREETRKWYELRNAQDNSARRETGPRLIEPPRPQAPTPAAPKPAPRPVSPAARSTPAPPVPSPRDQTVRPPTPPAREPQAPAEPNPHEAVLGIMIEDVKFLRGVPKDRYGAEYVISSVVSAGDRAAVFKAEDQSDNGLPMAVKVFNPELGEESEYDKILDKIVEYQSTMVNPNVVRILGTAYLESHKALVYEYLPLSVDALASRHPEGLPMDLIVRFLPQIFNGLAYCHTHRGHDNVIRKIPHLSLRTSKVLIDEGETVLKIDDCGVSMAVMDVRGDRRRYLWQEPGINPAYVAPECFVSRVRLINAFAADIYALGVVLYRLTTGKVPFAAENVEGYRFEHIHKFAVPPRVHRYDVPKWLDQMIMKCLEKEPKERWRSPTQMELAIGKEV
ncbi:MAG: protein kinase [Thermodesulfobacteriota bacterium]